MKLNKYSVLIVILMVIFAVELLIMTFLHQLNYEAGPAHTLLKAFLLAIICGPLIYYFLIQKVLNKNEGLIKRLARRHKALDTTALVCETDVNGIITYVNRLFCEISQYNSEELLGRDFSTINAKQFDKTFWERINITTNDDNEWRGEICNQTKDESYYWVHATISSIKSNEGDIVGYRAIMVNITDSKLIEIKEKNRAERVNSFNETLANLVRHPDFVSDKFDSMLLHLTKTVSSTLDIQRVSIWLLDESEEGTCINLSNLWDADEDTHLYNIELCEKEFPSYFKALKLDRLLVYDDVYSDPDVIEFTKEYFPSHGITSMLDAPFYQSGTVTGVICLEHIGEKRVWQLEEQAFIISIADILTIIFDSLKRKGIEEALRQSEKLDAMGKLTGGIAHDFNNVLGVIIGYSELLTQNLVDDEKLSGYAEQINTAGLRGSKLTNNLLSFARKKHFDLEHINLNDVIVEQKDMLQASLTVGIEISLELESDLNSILIDKNELEHALLNLSINAMHAMEDQGSESKLVIQTNNRYLKKSTANELALNKGNYVILSVIDTGCGIEKSELSNVFEPFYSTKGEKGTGLGLSQVFSFARRSEGSVSVSSEIGVGTEFSIYFPVHYKAEQIEALEHEHINKDVYGNETILVVDDEQAICALTTEMLKNYGYNTLSCNSAIEALKMLKEMRVDLIISDIVMPQMDGYQLSGKVLELYPEVSILLATGFDDNRDHSMVSEKLLNNILKKPFQPNDLLRKVRDLLDADKANS